MNILDGSNSKTKFTLNTATKQGGAIYYAYVRLNLKNIEYVNNSAPYGDKIGSYPAKIVRYGNETSSMVINDIGSGIPYDSQVQFALIDADEQVMVLNNEDQVSVNPVNNTEASMSGTNSVLLRNGIATFTNIVAIAAPGSQNVQFKITSKAITNNKASVLLSQNNINNILTMNFRYCKPGEEVSTGNTCRTCSPGTYSLTWSASACKQ